MAYLLRQNPAPWTFSPCLPFRDSLTSACLTAATPRLAMGEALISLTARRAMQPASRDAYLSVGSDATRRHIGGAAMAEAMDAMGHTKASTSVGDTLLAVWPRASCGRAPWWGGVACRCS